MTLHRIEAYLHRLGRELRWRGLYSLQTLAEVESHLLEALDQELRRGLDPDEAQEKALERFGSPQRVADQFLKESHIMIQTILLIGSAILGALIAYVDSRPTWDDTGITVMALLVGGGIIGLLLKKRPWLYALAFGLWIPLFAIVFKHDFMMLIVLIFPFIGVYGGWLLRRVSKKLLHSA